MSTPDVMKARRYSLSSVVSIVILVVLTGCSESSTLPPVEPVLSGEYILSGGYIVGPEMDGRIDDRESSIIWIRDNVIVFAGRADDVSLPDSIEVIDIAGKFVLPGLIDTHVHLPQDAELGETLRMLLAYGVTTVRSVGDVYNNGVQMRAAVESGSLPGPSILTSGRLIDGAESIHPGAVKVSTESEARQEVRNQASAGVDLIKVYTRLDERLMEVVIDEAHRHGLKVLGHLGFVSWSDAIGLGIDGLTHSGMAGPVWELIDRRSDSVGGSADIEVWLDSFNLDSPLLDTLGMSVLQHGAEINPTLGLTYAMVYGVDASRIDLFLPNHEASMVDDWRAQPHPFSRPMQGFPEDRKNELYQTFAAIINDLAVHGALITTGTDLGVPWMTPGVAMHVEMKLLEEAGLTPWRVLQAATTNGAEALGISSVTGEISSDFEADLIILSADPVDDIRNTRCIDLVVSDGIAYHPDQLIPDAGNSCVQQGNSD